MIYSPEFEVVVETACADDSDCTEGMECRDGICVPESNELFLTLLLIAVSAVIVVMVVR